MRKLECSLLISGATLAGLGACAAATAQGRDTVVIERTALVGSEFIEAFNPGESSVKPSQNSWISQLEADLTMRNILKENNLIHLPALHPVLCNMIKQTNMNVRFLTEIVDVTQVNGKFKVSLFDAAGRFEITADEILDTSSQRLTQPGQLAIPKSKSLNAYIHHSNYAGGELPQTWHPAMTVTKGAYPKEVILKLQVEADASYFEARQQMHQIWLQRPEAWQGWTISATASMFECSVPEGPHALATAWTWLPSAGYQHPLEAASCGHDFYSKQRSDLNAAIAKHS